MNKKGSGYDIGCMCHWWLPAELPRSNRHHHCESMQITHRFCGQQRHQKRALPAHPHRAPRAPLQSSVPRRHLGPAGLQSQTFDFRSHPHSQGTRHIKYQICWRTRAQCWAFSRHVPGRAESRPRWAETHPRGEEPTNACQPGVGNIIFSHYNFVIFQVSKFNSQIQQFQFETKILFLINNQNPQPWR